MTPEWLTAIASIGTFVVIAATALAALIQLRHMRSSNQIVALNNIWQTASSRDFLEASDYITQRLPQLIDDPEMRRKIAGATSFTGLEEMAPVRLIANFFEAFGGFVKAGIVDERLALDVWGGPIMFFWRSLSPITQNVRVATGNPGLWENFEYLAVRCQDFIKAHPEGTYPGRVRRSEMPPLWPETTPKTT